MVWRNQKYRILMTLGLMFFSSLSQAEKIPDSTLVEAPRYDFSLPIGLMKVTAEVEERTPWGRADVQVYSATDDHGVTFLFRAFTFPAKRQLETAKLKQVRSYFLQQRKCVAKDVDMAIRFQGNVNLWPQTLFEGYCAAPENFMVFTTIVHGRLYQMQVISKGFSSDKIASQKLMQSMKWFVEHTQIMAK